MELRGLGRRRAPHRLLGVGQHRKSDPELSSDKLATSLAAKLASTTGRPKPDITCPEDLAGKAGTETRCTLTADDGSTLGVTVTVTSVDGRQIHYDFQADQTASPAPN